MLNEFEQRLRVAADEHRIERQLLPRAGHVDDLAHCGFGGRQGQRIAGDLGQRDAPLACQRMSGRQDGDDGRGLAMHDADVLDRREAEAQADFRVACVEARFSANFNRLGFHPGFGLSLTLPRLIGEQQASLMFYTGRRIDGAAAQAMGLIDLLVDQPQVLAAALALAQEIATSAPLAVESTRATLREGLANAVLQANQRECAIQRSEFTTDDFREGVTAMAARRAPVFRGR